MDTLDRPKPYQVADRTEWIVSDEPDTAGFAILVRTGITNAEQNWLNGLHDEIAGRYQDEWNASTPEERDLAHSPRARELALLAPYILEWNAIGFRKDGTQGPIFPPAEAGPDAFDCVLEPHRRFCVRVVLNGYLVTGKALRLRSRLNVSGEPPDPDPPPEIPAPKKRTRRKSSSTPSGSTLTA